MNFSRIYRRIGGIIPKNIVERFEKKLKYAGIREEAREWLGARILLSMLFGMMLVLFSLNAYVLKFDFGTVTIEAKAFEIEVSNVIISVNEKDLLLINSILSVVGFLLAGFFLCIVIIYLRLYFKINDRARKAEKILPDFLLLVVSNLRAGMTPFSAFVGAARPEFGELYEEVKLATAKVSGKGSLDDALAEMSNYFDSVIIRRTVSLFVKGMRSGGHLAKLLNSSAEEVRRIQDLRAELVTATRMYAIFLGFIVVILMPFLLSISTHFIVMFLSIQEEVQEGLGEQSAGSIPLIGGTILIDPMELFYLSLAALLITSLLVSSLIGIISRGSAIYGIKYFPIFALASCLFFILAKESIGGMLSAFLGM